MTKKWIIAVIILLTVVNLSALGTFIYYRYCPGEPACASDTASDHGCYMKNQIGMTDSQAMVLNNCEKIYCSKFDDYSVKMKERRSELIVELMKEKSDTSKIEEMLLKIDSLQSGIQRQIINRFLKEKNILTPEQREKYFSAVLGKYCSEIDSIKNKCQTNNTK